MTMNPTFHQKNDYENMAFDVEYLKYQYKNNKSSEVAKINSHKYEYKENEYDDVTEIEQPTNKAPQNVLKTQRCRDKSKIYLPRPRWVVLLLCGLVALSISIAGASIYFLIDIKENYDDLTIEQKKINNDIKEMRQKFKQYDSFQQRLSKNINKSDLQSRNQISNNEAFNLSVWNTGPKLYRTCLDILKDGFNKSGLYNITPIPGYYKTVYCDQTFSGGGWIVFMRNEYGKITFDRTWEEYKNGFGNLKYDFWLGNEFLYRATKLYKTVNSQNMELYISLVDRDDNNFYARYTTFWVEEEVTKYRLIISGYNGTAGDSLGLQTHRRFTTKDNDNDLDSAHNCASNYSSYGKGGWWYYSCYHACLTKTFGDFDPVYKKYWPAPQWYHVHNNYNHLTSTTMRLREITN